MYDPQDASVGTPKINHLTLAKRGWINGVPAKCP